MAKTTFVAAKDLVIDSKPVKEGDVLFSIESEHPVERVLAAVPNASAVTPEELEKLRAKRKAAEAAPAAPVPAKK